MAPGYRWRLGVIALMCFLFTGWFGYDGWVKYPQANLLNHELEQLKQRNPDGYAKDWKDWENQHGLKADDYKDHGYSPTDLGIQKAIAIGALIPGLLFAFAFARSFSRWIASNEMGLTTSWGLTVPFSTLVSLNKDRWKSKGIAVVTYRDGSQRERRLVLDDWKFDAPATRALLIDVETHLTDEQIVGGAREGTEDGAAAGPPEAQEEAAQSPDDPSPPQ
jgi:hypothetical protein